MCDYCGDMDRKHKDRPLKEGVFGSILVDWFQHNVGITPVDAELLEIAGNNEYNYRITFDDESVADYKIRFESSTSLEIESCEEFNRVI